MQHSHHSHHTWTRQTRRTQHQRNQSNQTHTAWLWGPDLGTGREWSSERFREALERETHTRLGNAIHIAAYCDIAIGISRRFLRPSVAFSHNVNDVDPPAMDADAEEGMDIEQWMGHIADLKPHIHRMWL